MIRKRKRPQQPTQPEPCLFSDEEMAAMLPGAQEVPAQRTEEVKDDIPTPQAEAPSPVQEEEKEELLNRCAAVEETISAGADHGASDVAFHQYIAKCTHNDVLPEIIPIITYGVDLFTRIREKEPIENTMQYHRVITEAICANDPEAARQGMLDHLKSNLWCIKRLETMDLQPDTGNR